MGEKYRIDSGLACAGPAKYSGNARDELREENERLRNLVVRLTTIVLRNIAHHSDHSSSEFFKASANPLHDAGKLDTAETLEAAGHELMVEAAVLKSMQRRDGWKRIPAKS